MTEPANAVMEKAGEIFGKKYFGVPFPVILIGVAGAAYVVRRMIKGNEAAKEAAPATEGYAMDVSGNKFASAYTGQAGGVPFGTGSLTNAGASGISPITPATELNNEGWVRRATEKLNLLGQWNVMDIQTALQAYISGKQLDQRQAAIVQQATMVEGIAPINIIPGGVAEAVETITDRTSPEIVGLVGGTNNGAIWARYSDGTLIGVSDANQLQKIVDSNPSRFKNSDGSWKIDYRPGSDPIFKNIVSVG